MKERSVYPTAAAHSVTSEGELHAYAVHVIGIQLDVPARRIGVERWKEVFGIAEQRLLRREWAVGGYSTADIHLFRLFWRFHSALHPTPADFPGLCTHYARMMVRPAVQRVLEIESAVGYQLPH